MITGRAPLIGDGWCVSRNGSSRVRCLSRLHRYVFVNFERPRVAGVITRPSSTFYDRKRSYVQYLCAYTKTDDDRLTIVTGTFKRFRPKSAKISRKNEHIWLIIIAQHVKKNVQWIWQRLCLIDQCFTVSLC